MTEYQKIENALIPLGWTPEHRNGDHIRFSKEGITQYITVYKNITDKGRALQNAYADIRRVEPRFPLGRQAHMLGGEETESEPVVPEGVPPWMTPGRTVRWTAPEQHDWSKLSDPHSVMNKGYTIRGFNKTEEGLMAELEEPDSDVRFPVFVSDIDRWETAECDRCHTAMPLNRLSKSRDGKSHCEKCIGELIRESVPEKPLTPPAPSKQNDHPVKDMSESPAGKDPYMKELYELMNETQNMDKMSLLEKQDLFDRTKSTLAKASPQTRKYLRRKFPTIMEHIEEPKEKKPSQTPYQAWKKALNDLLDFNITIKETNPGDNFSKQMKKSLHSSTYSIGKLKDPKDKRKTAALLLTVTAQEWETAHIFWTGAEVILRQFRDVVPDNPRLPLYLLVQCQKAHFRQYTPDGAMSKERDEVRRDIDLLETLLPESEHAALTRAKGNLVLPPATGIHEDITRRINDAGLKPEEETGLCFETDTLQGEDDEDFETAPPIYRISVIVVNKEDPGAFERLDAQFRDGAPLRGPVRLLLTDWYRQKRKTYDYNIEPAQAETERAAEETTPATTLLPIFAIVNDGGRVIVTGDRDTASDRTKIAAALCAAADGDENIRKAFAEALQLFRHVAENNPEYEDKWKELTGSTTNEKKNDDNQKGMHTMDTKDLLDQFNPESEFPFLATVRTRDLLKELKARGVSFDNLAITVRKAIDINEI